MRRVYRRVLLIAPWLGPWPGGDRPPNVSVHRDPVNNRWVANTLGDLTKRENRAHRQPDSLFPHLLNNNLVASATEYLVLNDVLAIDVRIYDPGAPLYQTLGNDVVQPGDPGWFVEVGKSSPTINGFGAYCDLGWGWDETQNPPLLYSPPLPLPTGVPAPIFSVPHRAGWHPQLASPAILIDYPAVYDTWSYHYENDGLNQDRILEQAYQNPTPPLFDEWRKNTPGNQNEPVIDQGANGFDDDNLNGVDDVGERETSPPYDTPLRGLQVKFRVYEYDARQIREASVTHSFMP
jgi:hypothetical protein